MYDLIGLIGVGLILLLYALLQLEKIDPQRVPYSLGNLIGAIMILISLTHHFNLPSVVIECFWIAISLYGLIKALRR